MSLPVCKPRLPLGYVSGRPRKQNGNKISATVNRPETAVAPLTAPVSHGLPSDVRMVRASRSADSTQLPKAGYDPFWSNMYSQFAVPRRYGCWNGSTTRERLTGDKPGATFTRTELRIGGQGPLVYSKSSLQLSGNQSPQGCRRQCTPVQNNTHFDLCLRVHSLAQSTCSSVSLDYSTTFNLKCRPFCGLIVIAPPRTTSLPSMSSVHSKRDTMADSKHLNSALAKFCPMQLRGPCRNVAKS